MSTISYPYSTFTGGTDAVGSQVSANFTAITNVVNGDIDDDNILTGGITGSTKLANTSVTAGKLAANAVIESKMDYASANSGAKVVRSGPNYGGAGGVRLARVVKTIAIAGATTTLQSYQITWATDCVDGDPAFASVPVILGAELKDPGTHGAPSVITGAAVEAQRFFTEITTSGCWFNILFSTTATAGNLELHIGLMGNIA